MPVRSTRNSSQFDLSWTQFLRLAILACLIGGIGVLIWVKNINYVRASVEVGEAVEQYRTGDFQASLASLDKAIELAPDVSPYYNYRAQVYFAYQLFDQVTPERECSLQEAVAYRGCLDKKIYDSNLAGAKQRPFYYRSRWALANSALNLKQDALAMQLYGEVMSMVPNSRPMRNEIGTIYLDLARAYLEVERPQAALKPLKAALEIKPILSFSSHALFLVGTAYRDLERLDKATESMELSLQMGLSQKLEKRAHEVLAEIYGELGQNKLAEEHSNWASPP